MANVKINWNNTSMSGATDIDDIRIFRVEGDVLSSYTDLDTTNASSVEVSAAEASTFVGSAGSALTTIAWPTSGNVNDLAVEYIDASAADSTTYTYGIFSTNASGNNVGPGALASIGT